MSSLLKNKFFILVAVLIIGLASRLYSLNYGLPYVVGPDETRQILDTFSMGYRMSLIPQEFSYAALHKYILLAGYGIYFIFGKVFGIFSDKLDFAFKFISEPYSFYLLGRILSALIGTAVIFTVYKIAKEVFDKNTAIFAAGLAALNFHLVQLSYWATPDILVVFVSTLALLYIYKFLKTPVIKNALFAAFFTGLAVSSKLQGILVTVPLLVVLILNKNRGKVIILALVAFFTGASLGNAVYFIQGKLAIERLLVLSQEAKFGISSAPVFSHNLFSVIFWYAKELVRQDGIIGFIYIFGIIYSVVLRKKDDLIFLALVLAYLVSLSGLSLRYVYYLAAILPIASVFGARAILGISGLFKKNRKPFLAILSVFIIALSLQEVLIAGFRRNNPDTRQIAKLWVEKNIAYGSKIAVDWYELNVALPSDIPFMFRTGNAEKYYDALMPQEIKNVYKKYLEGKKYNIASVIYQQHENFWPAQMADEALTKTKDNPMFKRLYQRFNFKSLDDLINRGYEYLILSSFAYSHFLPDRNANKTGIYNPYIKEDTVSNNKQAERFEPAKEESTLYFLSKRAQDFYLPLLDGQNRSAKLIKEFLPDQKHLGPVIKIYKLEVLR